MNELVSIIVPVYKVENYIRTCLDSIICQSYPHLEIILVDDGSPDSCGQICDEYAARDDRVRVIHKENGGLSSARNAALDVASGEWILCVDSDDYLDIEAIEKMMKASAEYHADVVICAHYVETDGSLAITERIYDEVFVMSNTEALDKLIRDEEIKSYAWDKLFKRSFFEGVRFPEGRNYEDVATTYILFDRASKIVRIPEYLYYYRNRQDSISFNDSAVSWHKGCHASCISQEERASYLKERGYDELYDRAMAYLLLYLYSDIKTGYEARELEDVASSQSYIREHKKEFLTNSFISGKDKKLIDVYLSGKSSFSLYEMAKRPAALFGRTVRRARRHLGISDRKYDFKLDTGKKKRIVCFELPCFDNLGDHAIAYSTENLLGKICEKSDRQLFVIPGWEMEGAIRAFKKVISPEDMVVCQGGGNFGNLYEFSRVSRRKTLEAFRNQKLVVMPQSVYYSEDAAGEIALLEDKALANRCKDLTIFARDARSYEILKESFDANIRLMHDVVALMEFDRHSYHRSGILMCLRSDKEGILSAQQKNSIKELCRKTGEQVRVTDTCIHYDVPASEREKALTRKLELFENVKVVVTDRLHGMFFAFITRTPCIILDNSHHKNEQAYISIKDCGYIRHAESIEDISGMLEELLAMDTDRINRLGFPEELGIYEKIFAKDIGD